MMYAAATAAVVYSAGSVFTDTRALPDEAHAFAVRPFCTLCPRWCDRRVVTTNIPYDPSDPGSRGAAGFDQVRCPASAPPSSTATYSPAQVPGVTTTSREKDCTRVPCTGGVPTPTGAAPGGARRIGQVIGWALV